MSEIVSRVSTGVEGLDTVLHGGLLQGGLYIAGGPPGAGKTIFGNQFCFANVRAGGRAIFCTVLAEPHGRMLVHLRPLQFFREEPLGKEMQYLSGYAVLKKDGLQGLFELLQTTVRKHHATALVIDGFAAIGERAASRLELREWMQQLATHGLVTGCTTLLLTTECSRSADPEHAMVDGVLQLGADTAGLQTLRTLEVTKFRGSAHLLGKHHFEIGERGLRVYPRIESLYREPSDVVPDPKVRRGFGVKRLDEMMDGGLLGYSSTLLFGSPGAGKTLLGLHFLAEGARRGEQGLLVSFSETRERLVAKAGYVGLDLRPAVSSGKIRMVTHLGVEVLADAVVHEMLELVTKLGVSRVFVDGLEPLSNEPSDSPRSQRLVSALVNELRRRHVTSIFTQQTNILFGPELYPPIRNIEAITDNVVFLRYFEMHSQLYRLLSILKMRESDNDPALREFTITDEGIDVAATFESAEAILTGLARPGSGRAGKKPRKRGGKLLRRLRGAR